MNKRPHNVFGAIINFMLKNWESKHATNSLFEPFDIISATMALQFPQLLTSFFLLIRFSISKG